MLSWFLHMMWDKDLISFFWKSISTFLNTIYWRGCPFPILCSWYLCHNQLTINTLIYVWVHYFIPSVLSLFMPLLFSFDYYTFVIHFKISMMPPSLFFLFVSLKITLAIWGLLWSRTHFRIVFSILVKKVIGILIGIALNL